MADDPTDLDLWRAKLCKAGAAFWEETHGERHSLYFPDPDGVVLELTWPSASPPVQESDEAMRRVQSWITQQS